MAVYIFWYLRLPCSISREAPVSVRVGDCQGFYSAIFGDGECDFLCGFALRDASHAPVVSVRDLSVWCDLRPFWVVEEVLLVLIADRKHSRVLLHIRYDSWMGLRDPEDIPLCAAHRRRLRYRSLLFVLFFSVLRCGPPFVFVLHPRYNPSSCPCARYISTSFYLGSSAMIQVDVYINSSGRVPGSHMSVRCRIPLRPRTKQRLRYLFYPSYS